MSLYPVYYTGGKTIFVILPPQKLSKKKIEIADPAFGLVQIEKTAFIKNWTSNSISKGVVLMLEPTLNFYEGDEQRSENRGFAFLVKYLRPHKKSLTKIFLSLILGSVIAITLPFLTQSLVDYGISRRNIGFIYLILASQLALFVGSTAIEIIRSWILLHINTRINISIISDFLIKLMKLPIKYFDTKKIAEISQRIHDHERVEHFLTSTT